MTIKKSYIDLIEFLELNKSKKVEAILPEVYKIVSSKNVGSTYIMDVNNKAVAIRCYYFKRWMPLVGPSAVEFGVKTNTKTGFNTMCRLGTNLWTKQNNDAKRQLAELIDKLEDGKLAIDKIKFEKTKIQITRNKIEPTTLGFVEKKEVIKYLETNKVKLS